MASTTKKKSKNVDVISALRAFETTLRAGSRHRGVAVHRPLLQQLQQCQDTSTPLTEVVLSGLCSQQVVAVVDCLSYYPAVKSLSCLGCACGDQGLAAIAALLQASGSKWWMGSRLQSLELCSDCRQPSGAAAAGAPAVTAPAPPHSSLVPPANAPGTCSSSSSIQQLGQVRPASAPPMQQQQHQRQHQQHQQRPSICPAMPGYLCLPTGPPHVQPDSRLSALRPVRYHVHAPKTLMEVRSWALANTLGSCSRSTPSSPSGSSNNSNNSSSACGPLAAATCCFSSSALQQLSLALGVSGLQLQELRLDHTLLGDSGVSTLAAGLGRCSSLRVLSLRCCDIGLAGAQQLADALSPAAGKKAACSSSPTVAAAAAGSRMSVASVNPQLALPITPAGDSVAAAPAVTSSKHTAAVAEAAAGAHGQPCLLQLHLDGNPLGADGLHAVSRCVRHHMASIKILTLSDISLDASLDATQLEVQVLAHSLLAGPNELNTLDFSDNYISDELAMFFIGLLKAKPSLTLLKLSPRLSPGVMQQITALLTEHQHAAKAAKAPKKAKQPAA